MDFAHFGTEMTREQEMISTKKRLDTFQFRRPSGPIVPAPLSPTYSTGRPHSRHGSVSSVSFSASNSTMSVSSTSEQSSLSSSDSRPSSLVGRPRPTSHHRRRSSVSTRVESAEMMGVTLPDLSVSSSDDNINFGDKDSVRRRALQALEGRNDFGSCSNTVEIPELSSQGIPQKPFDRELKLPTSMPSFGISSLSGKRDSFGKFLSSASSLKDQLHTLMEEEEEEEEENSGGVHAPTEREPDLSIHDGKSAVPDCDHSAALARASGNSDASDLPSTAPLSDSSRHRPSNLTLRPLSLISNPSLPTPSLTPNSRAGLRSFSLASHSDSPINNGPEGPDAKWANQFRKQKTDLHSNSSSSSSSTSVHCQSSSGSGSALSTSPSPKRQSSISYIRSSSGQSQPTAFTFASLPTPGATPTSERRQSTSSISSFGSVSGQDRRNTSEDMFLHQSHASLLARIAELERALQSRPRSRPVSAHSDSSMSASEPPSDEMLQLVADLKAERDELNRDIEGWRQRVKDLEHAKTLLGHEKTVLERRLEAERREGWLKGEKLGLLEMEKGSLNRQLKIKEEDVSSVSRRLGSTQAQLHQAVLECNSLKEDAQVAKRQLAEAQLLLEARKETEVELIKVRDALAAEQMYRGKLISQLDAAGYLETPRVADKVSSGSFVHTTYSNQSRTNGLGFQSVDSACTTVDADEENQQALKAPFTLKAVEEESEMYSEGPSIGDEELARYEDEDELDLSFASPTRSMSSYDSDDDLPRSLSHLRLAANTTPVPSSSDAASSSRSLSSTPSPISSPCPTPIPPLVPEFKGPQHVNRASLSKAWTFPRGEQSHPSRPLPEEIDRFFGCLEDIDSSPPVGSCSSMDSRSIFSQRLHFVDIEDDDLPPFVLPAQKVAGEVGSGMLDVVLEEDENDSQCDTPDGRRKPSFPVSVCEDSLSRMSSPLFEDHMHTNSVPFVFPQMKAQQKESNPVTASHSSSGTDVKESKSTAAPALQAVSTIDRLSVVATPKGTSPRAIPPSRIPPPSPPMFIQAKTAVRTTPSPPKRKPVPSPKSNVNSASPSRIKPMRIPVDSPQRIKRPAPQSSYADVNTSSSSSSSEPQKAVVGYLSSHTSSAMKYRVDQSLNRRELGGISTPSTQPLLQTFTNFFPLPSFSWMNSRSRINATSVREPAYVSKERQLAKLQASLAMRRGDVHQPGEIDRCGKCQSGLISL